MQTETNSDFLLWKRFLQGDSDAYSQIYRQTVQDLFQYGLLYTSDRELIKDCIHDVFVKIYTNRVNLSNTNNITAYLIIALKNTLLNTLQKNTNHTFVEDLNLAKEKHHTDDTPETLYINDEQEMLANQTLNSMMSSLTHRQREIIFYRYMKDLSIEEISALTDMNYQSVSNSIQRALVRLRDLFKCK